jgi:hypothetical protein
MKLLAVEDPVCREEDVLDIVHSNPSTKITQMKVTIPKIFSWVHVLMRMDPVSQKLSTTEEQH